ncbi:hypothetical protein [Desulfovibrio sp. TomC]|uniref:hypothetical protein n=1 Tax=Desulfovibrio sp. TomC TaxID=1562888 RepID=UPI0012E26B67|nr:hypothetical protein [Desulfovibrio sp. TomC]
MNIKVLLCLAILCFFVCSYAFAELPHTFQAGQTAKASDVNENFQYLQKTKYVLKSNGIIIGDVVSFSAHSANIINEKGFLVWVHVSGQAVESQSMLMYDGDNCTGQIYVSATLTDTVFVAQLSNGFKTYYTRKSLDAPAELKSYWNGLQCYPYGSSTHAVTKAYPNDFNVTGVRDSYPGSDGFDTPITMEER